MKNFPEAVLILGIILIIIDIICLGTIHKTMQNDTNKAVQSCLINKGLF